MNDKVLDIFGTTLHTRWNSQNSDLKKKVMDYLEGMFWVDTFNRNRVTLIASTYLKYVRDIYRVQLQKNP